MKNKITEKKIEDLIPDDLNANKGTEYGQHLIEKSMRQFGFGRSVLIDKNNRIIAGNKSIQEAGAIGLENVLIIETTGDQIVAVKRTDIDIDTARGRELALADNATSKANLEWDHDHLEKIKENWDVNPVDWGIPEADEIKEAPEAPETKSIRLIVECSEPAKLSLLYSELQDRGFSCELKE